MLIERLKKILGAMRLPVETRTLVAGVGSTKELARRLDELITANELEFRTLQKEIEELERQEKDETDKVRAEDLGARSRKIALMRIQRLRRQQDGLETRMTIHDKNMNLHLGLLSKIQALEAMEMRGVEDREIDAVVLDFEDEMQRFSSAMGAGAIVDSGALTIDADQDRALADLEAEILGKEAASTPSESAAAPTKPARSREGASSTVNDADDPQEAEARGESAARRRERLEPEN